MKTIWHTLGSLKLAFWLLISATICLFIGSIYAGVHYSFFNTLNETPLHTWLAINYGVNYKIIWWIPLLLIIMALLGFNIFTCAWQRMARLLEKKKKMASNRFVVKLIPSIIHFLFLVIISGHFITFVFTSWAYSPLKTGETVYIGKIPSGLTVQSVDHIYFPDYSGLKGRIKQTEVTLLDKDGQVLKLSFLKPVLFEGAILQLGMRPNKQKSVNITPEGNGHTKEKEKCNKAHEYHVQPQKADKQLVLLSVADPGLYMILSAFTAILFFMVWYFISLAIARNKADA